MKFEIVIKIIFHLKIYKNNIFYFLKFILISIHQNNQKINKNLKIIFLKKQHLNTTPNTRL